MTLSQEQVKQFWDNGYLVLPDFADEETVEGLKKECHRLVEEMDPAEHNTVFTTLEMKRTSDDYFMTSGDKIRYFFEDGNLKVNKHLSINKIGHALHVLSEPFKKFTFCDKQPGIGGEVIPHQDSSFLHTDPMKLVGFWIALEDATLENGCLWFIPGSHKEGIHCGRRMLRNPNKGEGESGTIFQGEMPKYNDKDFIPGPATANSRNAVPSLIFVIGTKH
ncbi:PAHX-like protein [Mya arenaria]|uniref:PAHX-like protein n=1 Tax=Mya arenaria TaxID=6604 RepID=A0ABY7FRA4_MYAAR|nr:PAHX-like protein [Mya arenaria]